MLSLNKYLVLSLLLTLLLHTGAFSQELDIQNIEQITIATDRSLYISGEPMWYSAAYSVPGNTSHILSKVLYVELFNNDNQIITSQKVAIDNGIITGRIIIPEHVSTGYYILRAYTRYQENFPAWQFASVILSVVNPSHPLPPVPLPSIVDQTNIALMSDGNIAFRINEPLTHEVKDVSLLVNGLSVSAKGSYYSNGLGSFNHEVKPNDNLSLLIMLKSGDSIMSRHYSIKSLSQEILVSCKSDELELTFKSDSISNQQLEISITNLNSYKLTSQKMPFNVDSAFTKIPIAKTGRELLLLSVKNSEGVNVAQTICYFPETVNAQKSIIADSLIFSGAPISIDISEIDSSEYPLAVSMVMRGTHHNKLHLLPNCIIENPLYTDGFLQGCTLSDELLNQIHIAISLKQESLISLVKDDFNNNNMIIPEISGLTIQGKLINPQTNDPIKDELVYSSVLGEESQFHASTSLKDGSFVIPLNFLVNEHDIYLGTDIADENELEIQVDDGFCPIPPPWLPVPFVPDTSLRKLIVQMYMNYQVNSIFNVQRHYEKERITSNRPVFGNNLTQIIIADFIQLSSTPELFNELVPNVRARKRDNHYELVVLDDYLNIKYDNPLVLVDQVPYDDIDKIMEIQPTEIEQIDVASHVYAYGNNLFKGIIMIKTNTGNFAGLPISNGGVFVEYETLKPDIQFVPFSSLQNTSGQPDFANTVYWESLNSGDMTEQIVITAPSSIANYELYLISLKNRSKIIGSKKIMVGKKPSGN